MSDFKNRSTTIMTFQFILRAEYANIILIIAFYFEIMFWKSMFWNSKGYSCYNDESNIWTVPTVYVAVAFLWIPKCGRGNWHHFPPTAKWEPGILLCRQLEMMIKLLCFENYREMRAAHQILNCSMDNLLHFQRIKLDLLIWFDWLFIVDSQYIGIQLNTMQMNEMWILMNDQGTKCIYILHIYI